MENAGTSGNQLGKEMVIVRIGPVPLEKLVVSVLEGAEKMVPILLVLELFVVLG